MGFKQQQAHVVQEQKRETEQRNEIEKRKKLNSRKNSLDYRNWTEKRSWTKEVKQKRKQVDNLLKEKRGDKEDDHLKSADERKIKDAKAKKMLDQRQPKTCARGTTKMEDGWTMTVTTK